MKIAVLTTDNRAHERDYGAPAPRFGTAPEALLQGFARLPEVEIHVISCTQQAMIAPEKLAQNIWFHSLPVSKSGWLRTGYQGCIRAVRHKLRELKPDLVHGQGTERECALSAVFSGFPNVVTIHGNMAALAHHLHARPFSFNWLAGKLENFTLPRTAGVLCNSAYTEELVRPRSVKTWRVANALREAFFAPPVVTQASPGAAAPVLLNIGVISPRKRQLELLALASRLHTRFPQLQWRFIGPADPGDPYAKAFLNRIQASENTGWARYDGSLSAAQLIAEMDAAGAVVHFPTEEAFGLVVAEALARELKFFGARVGGIPDIAAGVPGAELIESEDWDGLSHAIENWAQTGCYRPSGAAEQIRQRFHPDIIARRHLEIYREVLSTEV